MDQNSFMPTPLNYVRSVGGSANTDVAEVAYEQGTRYALKRIWRVNHYERELEQMNYIKGELSILRKIQNVRLRHFIKLVASYTYIQHIGMLLSPVADCNLGHFLNNFNTCKPRDVRLLSSFFGCLATTLAHLHYVEKVRHKDIKPENILIMGNNQCWEPLHLIHLGVYQV
ncbi:hypothetical protein F4819DRAFT_479862 [Hypoxylon fuscum]|nr:hypothetical protein F4819DRAFT_479862 [Hypoxylon fuscum]